MCRLTSSSGLQTGKFQPKSKMQVHRLRNNIDIHSLNVADPVKYHLHGPAVPPRVDVVDTRSGPAFTPVDVIDFSSIGLSHAAPSQSTEVVLSDEELLNFVGASNQEAGVPGEHLESGHGKLTSCRANTGKGKTHAASDHSAKEQRDPSSNETSGSGRSLRTRKKSINTHKLVDESDNEGLEDGDVPAESLNNSIVNADDTADEEFQLEDELQKKKVRNKSKKSEGDKEKPLRKRKKDTEVSEQAAKAAPKKFSHSSRRRKVDKALLETPEDEIDIRQMPLRDLILLAEHKEQIAKKEAKASQAPLQNQSNGNHTVDGNEDSTANGFEPFGENETFASAQDGEANNDEESLRGEESPTYFNYQTYMDKTTRSRWSKQHTELFYQAVRQFGTDLSMIQHLFPGRTRRQIKLKYKKEERQNPLMLREVLSNPAKDHSHFELVIARLKQIAAEENQNTSRADSISLTGEEEIDEETPETIVNTLFAALDEFYSVIEEAFGYAIPDSHFYNAWCIQHEEAKSEQIEESANNTKPDSPETQSPVASRDSDDDFLRWSQYKGEL